MQKQAFLEQFKRRAEEVSCPARKLRKKAEELELHHDFLVHTARKEGLSDFEAESRASQQLGNPIQLAEQEADAIRQKSWWGRHPILGYVVLPFVSLLTAILTTVLIIALIIRLRFTNEQLQVIGSGPSGLRDVRSLLQGLFVIHYVVLTVFAIPFTWMARRSASGLGWTTLPCLIFAFQGMFLHLSITFRGFPLVYGWEPVWLGGIGPLLIAFAAYFRQWQRLRPLEPLPDNANVKPSGLAAVVAALNKPIGEKSKSLGPAHAHESQVKSEWLKKAVRTPTYWVVAIICMIIIPVILLGTVAFVASQNRNANRNRNRATATAGKANTGQAAWPAERDAALEQMKTRQAAKDTVNESTIDLSPYINVQLSESVDGKKDLQDNNLMELPVGAHNYGGVPFNVQGRIQLMGHGLEEWGRVFPVKSKEIRVERKCAKIHIFHGECCNMNSQVGNATIAKLLVHYADGSDKEIEIKSGVNVLDWWGPIYTTQTVRSRRFVSAPDSELAWAGQNPWIAKNQTDFSLRLFKSTFANPQPDVAVEYIEYSSTMTKVAPFMLGLTVE